MTRMKGHFYFIGIAGHAIRGLALMAREHGYRVSGLDEGAVPPGSDWLDEHDIPWSKTFEPSQLDGVGSVIVTGAYATPEYPAIVEAKKRGIEIKSWAQMVGELTANERSIVVAGTHGKTTTTGFITWLMERAGRKPDFLVGIQPFNFDSSVRLNSSGLVVLEGDEYKASDLEDKAKLQYYHPDVLVLTSVEHDHPDVYPDLESVVRRFSDVVEAMPRDGRLVAWSGSETVGQVAAKANCQVVTYGLDEGDYMADGISFLPTGIEFDVKTSEGVLGRLTVPLYGRHNVLNALAAVAVALGEGLSFEQIQKAAADFKGTYRRFNILTEPGDPIAVIDDYAHHPTEARTTIEAAKLHFPNRRLITVFRPHTYSRTKALLSEYQTVFSQADKVYITDVEGAREAAHEKTVSGADVIAQVKGDATFEPDRAKLVEHIALDAKPGDVVLCMTVSGYENLAPELAEQLNS
jgi:UDP-N-acetylmuramate: L-alanyl-gamma-D-glutamyl-meso-diaminopimelate ligase